MYEAKNFTHLLGTPGFSDTLLNNHFTLYQGYVTNTNKVSETLTNLLKEDKAGTPEFAELTRRFGWEFNGMRLHEYYFENLKNGGSPLDQSSSLAQKITANFGSFEMWEKDFRAKGSMRGIGWVILAHDMQADRLFNVWINEHDVGHLAGANPVLIMDVFEHAFTIDYGLKRAEYINAFFAAIDWEATTKRISV
jgi:Fe-Mn family superoxide dismutase